MNTNFKIIFSVKILHSYFDGDICTCLEFQPAAGTLGLMKRFRFTLNENINGFEFYSTSTVALRDSLDYIKAATGQGYFEFNVFTNTSAFYSFTTLPINWIGALMYDSAVIVSTEEKTILLKETFSAPETTGIVGKLKVNFDDIVKYTADMNAVNFEISFTARETQWQYYVVNRNAVQLDNATVKGKGDIVFENSGSVIIETGEKALLFSSGSQLIPLSKFPKHKFDLVNNQQVASNNKTTQNSSSKMIIKGLPNPDPLKMGTVQINDKTQVSSPIYIYV